MKRARFSSLTRYERYHFIMCEWIFRASTFLRQFHGCDWVCKMQNEFDFLPNVYSQIKVIAKIFNAKKAIANRFFNNVRFCIKIEIETASVAANAVHPSMFAANQRDYCSNLISMIKIIQYHPCAANLSQLNRCKIYNFNRFRLP